jgi:hypothetical protein
LKKLKKDCSIQDVKVISALISNYLCGNLALFSFLKKLKHQIGSCTTLRVTDSELGIIMKGQDFFITDKAYIIKNKYPNYKFSMESINHFEANIKSIFGYNGNKIYRILQKLRI